MANKQIYFESPICKFILVKPNCFWYCGNDDYFILNNTVKKGSCLKNKFNFLYAFFLVALYFKVKYLHVTTSTYYTL